MLDEGLSEGAAFGTAMELLEGQTLHEFQAGRASERSMDGSASFRDRTTVTRTSHGLNDALADSGVSRLPAPTTQPQGSVTFERTRAPLGIYRGICETLEHLHHMGLVHRDLKPSKNVFLRDERTPVLMDFGLASLSAGGVGREALGSDLGTRLHGTLPYLSPEQLRGELVDARADLYALGCMLL